MIQPHCSDLHHSYLLPPTGDSPGTDLNCTTPGSFARPGRVGTPWTFSSPDTPGMPLPSDRTAWDFMPADWTCIDTGDLSTGVAPKWSPPLGFQPITQLEYARMGTVTPEMNRVSEREPHLSPGQVRDEVAAGRMIIPANCVHLSHRLDPMAPQRSPLHKMCVKYMYFLK